MRSGELARLAGTTVRTLRHYRSIGLIPEPCRLENGYADYTAEDLARVLRIKHLASLGLPLDAVRALLSETDELNADVPAVERHLDALDRELAAQIEELQAKRATLSLLRSQKLDLDVPPRFGKVLKALVGRNESDAGSPLSPAERTSILLTAHLYDEPDLDELERFAQALVSRGLQAEYRRASDAVDALAADAPEEERAQATRLTTDLLDQLIDCFDARNWTGPATEEDRVIDDYACEKLNAAQLDVSERITAHLMSRL